MDFMELKRLYLMVAVACVAVLIAIAWDLCSGLLKAKIRGEVRTSYAYNRTSLKLLTNEGLLCVVSFVDLFQYLGHAWELIGLPSLDTVPVVTLATAAWLCFVQAVSIKEKAASKTEKRARKQLQEIIEVLPSTQITEILKALGKIGDNAAEKPAKQAAKKTAKKGKTKDETEA